MALRERGRLAAGESVLALGASGAVGGAAVSLAKAMGAGKVLAGITSPKKWPQVRSLGADAMIDLSTGNLRNNVREQIFSETDGKGVDIILDPIGGDAFHGAIRALSWRGRLVVIGFAAGDIPSLKTNYLLLKNIEVSGLQISDYRKKAPELVSECYQNIFDLYTQQKLQLPTVTPLPLSAWRESMEAIEQRSAPGRLVLLPQQLR